MTHATMTIAKPATASHIRTSSLKEPPMKALGFALALALASGTSAAAQQQFPNWSVSFQPGGTDEAGNFLGGTEIRDLTVFGSPAKVYASINYWMDQPGPEGPQQAQVLVLDGPNAQWRQDVNFGDFCTPPEPKRCALGTGALTPLRFTKDKNGAAANVVVLTASIWPIGPKPQPIKAYMRNNSDGLWYQSILGTADAAQIRSYATHVDTVTGESLAFAGASSGIYHGWLSPKRGAGQTIIDWAGGDNVEWNAAAAPAGTCGGGGNRIMALAEAEGRLFLSKCFDVLVRTDGPQGNCRPDEVKPAAGPCEARWKPFWTMPNAPFSDSGLRGMTQVTAFGQQWLLIGYEGVAPGYITRLDPKTGAALTELDTIDTLTQAWNMPVSYIITSYSAPMPLWYGADGRGRRILGFEASINKSQAAPSAGHSLALLDRGPEDPSQQYEGEGWYFLRDAAWSYRLFRIPPITAGRMLSVRAAVASPWKEDCDANGRNCAIFFGGFDCNKGITVAPCFSGPCNLTPVPTHNTAWIVKGYN